MPPLNCPPTQAMINERSLTLGSYHTTTAHSSEIAPIFYNMLASKILILSKSLSSIAIIDNDDNNNGEDDYYEIRDTDGDGTPDSRDLDIDGDGVPNTLDSDVDGNGVPNTQEDR